MNLSDINTNVIVLDHQLQVSRSATINPFLALKPVPFLTILQFSSAALTTFESMIEILADIGAILPQFERYMELFQNSANVRHVLCLFYRDLLDFFVITLNFISKKSQYHYYTMVSYLD